MRGTTGTSTWTVFSNKVLDSVRAAGAGGGAIQYCCAQMMAMELKKDGKRNDVVNDNGNGSAVAVAAAPAPVVIGRGGHLANLNVGGGNLQRLALSNGTEHAFQ